MAYRDSTTAVTSGSGTVNVSWPTVAAHDRALLFVSGDGAGRTVPTPPTGFTQLDSIAVASPDKQTLFLFEKKDCTGSETGSLTVTLDSAFDVRAFLGTWSGRHNTNALTFETPTVSSVDNSTPISMAASSGTAGAGDDVVAFFGLDKDTGSDIWTCSAPSGFTSRQDADSNTFSQGALFSIDSVSSGAFGVVTSTATRTSGTLQAGWGAFVVALPFGGPTASFTGESASRRLIRNSAIYRM